MHVSHQHQDALGLSRASQSLIDKEVFSDLVLGNAGFNPALHRFVVGMSGSVLQSLCNSRAGSRSVSVMVTFFQGIYGLRALASTEAMVALPMLDSSAMNRTLRLGISALSKASSWSFSAPILIGSSPSLANSSPWSIATIQKSMPVVYFDRVAMRVHSGIMAVQ